MINKIVEKIKDKQRTAEELANIFKVHKGTIRYHIRNHKNSFNIDSNSYGFYIKDITKNIVKTKEKKEKEIAYERNSLSRMVKILRILSSREKVTINEIGKKTGFNRSTVVKIISALRKDCIDIKSSHGIEGGYKYVDAYKLTDEELKSKELLRLPKNILKKIINLNDRVI